MRNNEQGFVAIIDLLVAVAFSAVIAVGAGMTTVQVLTVTKSSEDQSAAVRQAQNLGHWVSQDFLAAETVNMTDDGATPGIEFITVKWEDWETGDIYDARYTWADPSAALKQVLRKLTVRNRSGVTTRTVNTLVADSISSANVTLQGVVCKLNVVARSGSKSVTREYEITKRVGPR